MNQNKKNKVLKALGLVGVFLMVFGLSYALFQVTLNGTKKVKIKTGKLELQLLDASNNPIYSYQVFWKNKYIDLNLKDNSLILTSEPGFTLRNINYESSFLLC